MKTQTDQLGKSTVEKEYILKFSFILPNYYHPTTTTTTITMPSSPNPCLETTALNFF